MLAPPHCQGLSSARTRSTLVLAAACVGLLFLLWHWNTSLSASPSSPDSWQHTASHTLPKHWSVTGQGELEGVTKWEKPKDFKIVGLVFFGRRASVSILDCYLKRNLAVNSGFLDEVHFIARTKDEEDLAWLDEIVALEPAYSRVNISFEGIDYTSAYDDCEPGTMYIKMDDDLVFLEDHAIPTVVQTKLEHPEYFVVAANVVNQPSLSWMHYRLGAIKPYLPELHPPPLGQNESLNAWRASELPTWNGPPGWKPPGGNDKYEPPFQGHRWLPLPEGYPIQDTPIEETSFHPFSWGLWHWTIAAQEHYSFFENLENNELWKYKFHTLHYYGMRMGIQLIAIWGEDILATDLHNSNGDDEYFFTEVMPKRVGRQAVVDGRAVVAHYSFHPQSAEMETTDALDRYRAYAAENICQQR